MPEPATVRAWRDGRGSAARRTRGRGARVLALRAGSSAGSAAGALVPDLALAQPSGRGKYRCIVCGTVHSDRAGLALHQRSQRHNENVARLRARGAGGGGNEAAPGENGVDDTAGGRADPAEAGGESPPQPDGPTGGLEPLLGEIDQLEERMRLEAQYSTVTATGLPHIAKLRDLASRISPRARPRQFLKEYYETGQVGDVPYFDERLSAALGGGGDTPSPDPSSDFSFTEAGPGAPDGGNEAGASPRVYIPPRPAPGMTPEVVVTNVIHPETGAPGVLLELLVLSPRKGALLSSLPERPAWRLVSSYEQEAEPVDPRFQYVVVSCPPYENTAVRIPNAPVDLGACCEAWHPSCGLFCVQVFMAGGARPGARPGQAPVGA